MRSIVVLILSGSLVVARVCTNLTVPVTISSRNGVFGGIKVPVTNLDATEFALNATRQGPNGTAGALTGYATVSGTYQISAKYCVAAANTTRSKKLQILTHGIGFDKVYWDLPYNNYNYSYVNSALAAGYATFSYDRLGIGNSSHGEPLNEIQSFLEVQALAALTNKLRDGTVSGIRDKFSKIVHVGHSFGSAQTYSLVAQYPNISDAIILTGFSMQPSGVGLFTAGNGLEQAYLNQPLRFGNKSALVALNSAGQVFPALADFFAPIDFLSLPQTPYRPGYLVSSNAGNVNYLFLLNGYFDPQILAFLEQNKQPVTPGEALTLTSLPQSNPYDGKVLVLGAEYDVPYCSGNCSDASAVPGYANLAVAVGKNFPNASAFEGYLQPNTAHGINAHYNATGAYAVVQNFLKANGV